MNSSILIDTGPLVAIISPKDNYHQVCLNTLKIINPPLLTTWPVITEAHWLLRQDPRAVSCLFKMIEGEVVRIVDLPPDSVAWLRKFLLKYQDIGAQIADASLCYLAETHNLNIVFTMDRRDFLIYRINNNELLKIIP